MSLKDQKIYYSIGEVAKILDVNNSLIRFWEKEFEIIKPKKNSRGNRIFTKNDNRTKFSWDPELFNCETWEAHVGAAFFFVKIPLNSSTGYPNLIRVSSGAA